MGETILKLENLSKIYTLTRKNKGFSKLAVNNVNLEVYKGEILGLLGPNGAGKSTILKMVCGLLNPTSGSIYIKGDLVRLNESKTKESLGALIDIPIFYNKLSGYDNLKYLAALQGNVSHKRIMDIVKVVGLEEVIKNRVSTYSFGMLKRLGLAQAIMHKPKLLVLDEPTNGLDPKWIMEIRTLLKKLASEYEITIVVSSHVLSEMQEMCDRVAILNNGELVFVRPIKELQFTDDGLSEIIVKVDNVSDALKIIEPIGTVIKVNNDTIHIKMLENLIPDLTRELVLAGVPLKGIDVKKRKLEDVFSELTLNNNNDSAALIFNELQKTNTVVKEGQNGLPDSHAEENTSPTTSDSKGGDGNGQI